MTEVGIETLKERLSDYLKLAQEGERVLITDQGRSIAVLSPIEESEAERRAWELVETGVASWSGGKPQGSRQKPKTRGKSASEIVLEDREILDWVGRVDYYDDYEPKRLRDRKPR